jgi:tRNA A-37 threonylcarbamoyl transferase component Bud32
MTLRDRFAQNFDNMDLLERVGKALAYVHEHLTVPNDFCFRVESDWKCEDKDMVVLHGDFNLNNVCYQQDADRIVILDWASVGVIGRGKTMGSRYLDVGKFLRSLLCQQCYPIDSLTNYPKRVKAFLKGYQSGVEFGLNLRSVKNYLLKMSRRRIQIQFRRREFRKAIGNSIVYALLKGFFVNWKNRMILIEMPYSDSAYVEGKA